MLSFDRFKEHAKRALSIPSTAESGNEELARYFQSIMHDYGFKTQLQAVNHSMESLSKRQCNLIGFTSDALVDRSTRRGVLFINPLDVTTGNLPQLWSASNGKPEVPVVSDREIIGVGAVQGKLDFLCRIYAGADLLDKRQKNPLYIVGTCASHSGMMGSRFLIESLSANPKEVYSYAPTELQQCRQAPGQVSFSIDLQSSARDRDSRGYNRSVEIISFGKAADFCVPSGTVNAFHQLMNLILDAVEMGFDFQWSAIETQGASGTNPDLAKAKLFLTAFQFEDFKQFLRNKIGSETSSSSFKIDYAGITEGGTSFIPSELIEVILELDFEWKKFIQKLNTNKNEHFMLPQSVGALTSVCARSKGRLSVSFELRFLPEHDHKTIENEWKTIVEKISVKYPKYNLGFRVDYVVQGVMVEESITAKNSNYMSDAGLFKRANFPVVIMGSGSVQQSPKGPNEMISWAELKRAVEVYKELMIRASKA